MRHHARDRLVDRGLQPVALRRQIDERDWSGIGAVALVHQMSFEPGAQAAR